MSSEKTANLGMHKWLTSDYVKMAEFNENFKKLDDQAGEIKEAKTDIDGVVQAGLPERLTADFGKVTAQLADIPNQTYITEKAKTVDVNNALALKANDADVYKKTETYNQIETETIVNTKRDKNVKINAGDLDISSDSNKVQLINLSQDVHNALSGTASVYPDIQDVSVTNTKIAPAAVTSDKLGNQYNYKRILTSTDDLNGNLDSGVYLVQSTISMPVNVPIEFQNKTFYLTVAKADTYYNLEIAQDFSDPSFCMLRRTAHSGTPSYTDWKFFQIADNSITPSKLTSEYNYYGILDNTKDLNNVTKTGIYLVQATISKPLNVPNALSNSTSVLINIRYFGAYTTQIMFDFTNPSLQLTRTLSGTTVVKDWLTIGNTHKLAGKKLLTMGDSITAPGTYQNYIKQITGATIVNIGYAGAKFTSVVGHDPFNAHSFYELATTADLTDIDYIWVAYGTNDYSNDILLGTMTENNPAHFKSAIYEGIKSLLTRKPTLKIIFGTPLYRAALRSGNPTGGDIDLVPNDVAGLYLKDYCDAIVEVCKHFRVPVFDGLYECGINEFNIDTYLADKLHPNDTGHELIGKRYGEFINKYV